jgi:cytoskeleton protein RodZ
MSEQQEKQQQHTQQEAATSFGAADLHHRQADNEIDREHEFQHSFSPGAVLAAERQARGWSVEYVASHLKLAIRQIHALEEDHYAALPGAVITRGFIRIYAKMLGIDPTTLVAQLPVDSVATGNHARPARTLSTPFSESSLPLRGRRELPVTALVWLGVAVIVMAGLFAASKYGAWDQIKNSTLLQRLHLGASDRSSVAAVNGANGDADAATEPGSKPLAVADSENAVPLGTITAVDDADAAAKTAAVTDTGKKNASDTSGKGNTSATNPTSAKNSTADLIAKNSTTSTIAAKGANGAAGSPGSTSTSVKNTNSASSAASTGNTAAPVTSVASVTPAAPLHLTVRQDSWIEVRRSSDNHTMISRVVKAGSTETFDITEPVTLIVGNAAGVDATLRGQPLELGATTGNNVARLSLK